MTIMGKFKLTLVFRTRLYRPNHDFLQTVL